MTLSVPYIQNNLHKRTIVILIGLDRCREGREERGGKKVKHHVHLRFLSARVEGLGRVSRTGGRRLRCKGGVGWDYRFAFGVGREAGRGKRQEAVSAALPDFDCLIDTSCHHVGSSLMEICKRGKQLFRFAALNTSSLT